MVELTLRWLHQYSDSTARNHERSKLLSLPPEVRNMMFKYALRSEDGDVWISLFGHGTSTFEANLGSQAAL